MGVALTVAEPRRMARGLEQEALNYLHRGHSYNSMLRELRLLGFDNYCVENLEFARAVTVARRQGRVRSGRANWVRGDEVDLLPESLRP